MPVYTDDVDTLKDFFIRKIEDNGYYIEPLVLSEWIYGYVGDDFINKHNPEVLEILGEAENITPDLDKSEILTEFVTIVNKMHSEFFIKDMNAWKKYYADREHTPVTELALKYLQEI